MRIEAYVTNFLYNSTQKGWCETRIINNTIDLSFLGSKPLVFKPGMPLEGQIAVRFADQVPLDQERLEQSTLTIRLVGTTKTGKSVELPSIELVRGGGVTPGPHTAVSQDPPEG